MDPMDITTAQPLNLGEFHTRMALLGDEIINGKLAVTAVVAAGCHVHSCVGELTSLKDSVFKMEEVFDFLEANRGNYEAVMQKFQSSWSSWVPDHVETQITNEFEFDQLLSDLRNHAKSMETKIDQFQGVIDKIGIVMIFVNCAMVYNNLTSFTDDRTKVAEYARELQSILQRLAKAQEWFQKSHKGEKEQSHLHVQLVAIWSRFVEVRSALQSMRKDAVHRGLYSMMVGGASVGMAFILPFSSPWIFFGLAASGAANALTGALQFKIVGDIEELVPAIQQIESDYQELLRLSSQANDLPNF